MTTDTKKDRIAHDLRDAIATGILAPGDTLPSIRTLMDRYDCAWETARSGVNVLVHEGLVIPQRGVGTLVRHRTEFDVHYDPQGRSQTWAQMAGAGATDMVLTSTWESADAETAAWLAIEPGEPVLHRFRHRTLADGVPVETHEQWIVQDAALAVAERFGLDLADPDVTLPADLFMVFAMAGQAMEHTTEWVRARMPDEAERESMQLPLGVPVTVKRRLTMRRDGDVLRPVEGSLTVSSDRITHSYTMPIAQRLNTAEVPAVADDA